MHNLLVKYIPTNELCIQCIFIFILCCIIELIMYIKR